MAAPTVRATPFRKSRRVISRFIPMSLNLSNRIFPTVDGPQARIRRRRFLRLRFRQLDFLLPAGAAIKWLAVLGFLYRYFRSLKPDATVRPVTEWFCYRSAAAT